MTTYELCPLCGEEVELTTDKLVHRCPSCGEKILACSSTKGNDMERLTKKIGCIKLKAQIYDYLVGELYPTPECDNCEYNFTRFSSGKCFKCDGASQFVLAKGIQTDLRRMVNGIIKITNENGKEN